MVLTGMALCVLQIFAFLWAGMFAADDDAKPAIIAVLVGVLCLAGGLALVIGGVS